MALRFPQSCYGTVAMFLFLMTALVSIKYHSQGSFPLKLGLPVALMSAFFALFSAILSFASAVFSAFTVQKGNAISLRVTHDHVFVTGGPSVSFIRWVKVARIIERDGDIYLLPKPFGGVPFAIPCTAFADVDAARRFHSALVALWKANGNPDAVPESTRAEFAPSSQP